jgi:hypothetical protein
MPIKAAAAQSSIRRGTVASLVTIDLLTRWRYAAQGYIDTESPELVLGDRGLVILALCHGAIQGN